MKISVIGIIKQTTVEEESSLQNIGFYIFGHNIEKVDNPFYFR